MSAELGDVAWSPRATQLRENRPGLWTAPSTTAVSYPDDAHDLFNEVEQSSFWFAHRNACIVATAHRLPPSGLVADVGGGNGYVTQALRDASVDVILVEPSPHGAVNAWQRGITPVICAKAEDAGFTPHSLGGVGLFDVLEHISDDHAFLRSLKRFLRDDGRLYLTVPAFNALWSDEDTLAGHARRYTPAMLRAALATAGFAVEYLTGMFTWLPIPVFLARSLPSRLGLRHGDSMRTRAEHLLPAGLVGSALRGLLRSEVKAIAAGRQFPIGGSLLAVARPVV
jgi:SAM-dependent methyltransferase